MDANFTNDNRIVTQYILISLVLGLNLLGLGWLVDGWLIEDGYLVL